MGGEDLLLVYIGQISTGSFHDLTARVGSIKYPVRGSFAIGIMGCLLRGQEPRIVSANADMMPPQEAAQNSGIPLSKA